MQSTQAASKAIVVKAPSPVSDVHSNLKSVFLAGVTSGSHDWRAALTSALADLPIVILNPLRPDWDSSWIEDVSCAPYKKQVEWELQSQEKATVVAVYFGAETDAPISLLELGLHAKERKAIVYVENGYRKRGNVQIVCERYEVQFTTEIGAFQAGIRKLLAL